MYYIFILLGVIFFSKVCYIYFTSFSRNVKVGTKYASLERGKKMYHVFDEERNEFLIDRNIFITNKECRELWEKIQEGIEYQIEGYGLYLPYINIYPKITKVMTN